MNQYVMMFAMSSISSINNMSNTMKLIAILIIGIFYFIKNQDTILEKIRFYFRKNNHYFVEFSKESDNILHSTLKSINYCCNNIFHDISNVSFIGEFISCDNLNRKKKSDLIYFGEFTNTYDKCIVIGNYLHLINTEFKINKFKDIIDKKIYIRWIKAHEETPSNDKDSKSFKFKKMNTPLFFPILSGENKECVYKFINFCREYYHFINNQNKETPSLNEIISDRKEFYVRRFIATKLVNKNFDNIFLSADNEKKIHTILNNFFSNKQIYKDLGTPHKLGLLFNGPPGEGKSSLIYAIANQYGMSVDLVRLDKIKNDHFSNYCTDARNRIIVIEEIDTFEVAFNRELKKDKMGDLHDLKNDIEKMIKKNDKESDDNDRDDDPLKLDTLLTCLDGTRGFKDCIIIITTNRIDMIDPAIYRKGRMDHIIEFDKCDRYQLNKIFNKFYKQDYPANHKFEDHVLSVSEIINTIVFPNMNDMDAAIYEISSKFS